MAALDEGAVAASVRQALASTDTPEFDRIARLIYQARLSKLAAGMQPTPLVRAQSLAALALAEDLDRARPGWTKYWVSAFGSYEKTTTTMLTAQNLP